jgi:hypothetical protein
MWVAENMVFDIAHLDKTEIRHNETWHAGS